MWKIHLYWLVHVAAENSLMYCHYIFPHTLCITDSKMWMDLNITYSVRMYKNMFCKDCSRPLYFFKNYFTFFFTVYTKIAIHILYFQFQTSQKMNVALQYHLRQPVDDISQQIYWIHVNDISKLSLFSKGCKNNLHSWDLKIWAIWRQENN